MGKVVGDESREETGRPDSDEPLGAMVKILTFHQTEIVTQWKNFEYKKYKQVLHDQNFIEHVLHARHCSKSQYYSSEQNPFIPALLAVQIDKELLGQCGKVRW